MQTEHRPLSTLQTLNHSHGPQLTEKRDREVCLVRRGKERNMETVLGTVGDTTLLAPRHLTVNSFPVGWEGLSKQG